MIMDAQLIFFSFLIGINFVECLGATRNNLHAEILIYTALEIQFSFLLPFATYSVTQPLGSVFILLYSLKIYSFYFITRLFLPSFLEMPHYLSLKSVLYSLIFS